MPKSTQCEGATPTVSGNPSEPTRDIRSCSSLSPFLPIPSASYLLRTGNTEATVTNSTSQPATLPPMSPPSWTGLACSALHTSWVVLGCCHVLKSQGCTNSREQYNMAPWGPCVHSRDPSGSSVKPSCYGQLDTHFQRLSSEAVEIFSEQRGPHTGAPGP